MAKEKSNLELAEKRWTENTEKKGPEFCEGIAKFLGVEQCSPSIQRAYTEGVRGKGPVWAREYKRKMSGVTG